MRSYKTYIILIFLVYLTLIILFHTELQRNTKTSAGDVQHVKRREVKVEKEWNMHINEIIQPRAFGIGGKILQVTKPKPDFPILHKVKVTTAKIVKRAKTTRAPPHSISHNITDRFLIPYKKECEYSHSKIKTLKFQPIERHYIYSAYYDDRKSVPMIRMISLVASNQRFPLFCIFETENPKNRFVTTKVIYYEMCENHARPYGGWILSCEVPKEVRKYPCQIRLSRTKKHDTGIIVPVLASNNLVKKPQKDFAICIPPLFGYIKPELLIQFIEISLILGAKHFNFYTFQAHRNVEKILQYYVKQGVVSITPWKLPIPKNHVWYNGQLLTINDCLYRNMYHFKYIAFNDIDEFIVPHAFQNWQELTKYLEPEIKHKNISGFSFPSAFFNIDLREHRKQDLFFVIETRRTQIFSQVRTKVMVSPPNIFELGIHHISRPMPDHLQPYRMDPTKAFLHHYRKCIMDFDPRMKCNQLILDPKLLTYEPIVKSRSDKVMKTVFGVATAKPHVKDLKKSL